MELLRRSMALYRGRRIKADGDAKKCVAAFRRYDMAISLALTTLQIRKRCLAVLKSFLTAVSSRESLFFYSPSVRRISLYSGLSQSEAFEECRMPKTGSYSWVYSRTRYSGPSTQTVYKRLLKANSWFEPIKNPR
jgi:hypothetical protein